MPGSSPHGNGRVQLIRLGLGAALLAALATAGCGATGLAGTQHRASSLGCKLVRGAFLAFTPSYRLVLRVGPVQSMLMPYQVRANHVKHGEVMLGGKMVVPAHGPLRHLEVHICAKGTRAVITHADPTIVLTDESRQGPATKIPVAVMEGISAGRSDLHYGNNIAMRHRDRYAIAVTIGRERAIFHVAAP